MKFWKDSNGAGKDLSQVDQCSLNGGVAFSARQGSGTGAGTCPKLTA